MPRGMKRSYDSANANPMVGKNSSSKCRKVVKGKPVAMTVHGNKQNLSVAPEDVRRSSRARKQIKFENGERIVISGCNNNTLPCKSNERKNNSKGKSNKAKGRSSQNQKVQQKPLTNFRDGVKVTVNSDEDELDYDDILLNEEEELGSIDEEDEVPVNDSSQSNNRADNEMQMETSTTSLTDL